VSQVYVMFAGYYTRGQKVYAGSSVECRRHDTARPQQAQLVNSRRLSRDRRFGMRSSIRGGEANDKWYKTKVEEASSV
jgi:hypothetical protein